MISICIPAYKRLAYLEKLLVSIGQQRFRDFEVIVTDDSPDDSVALLCERFEKAFPLHYHKNEPALGTPKNWNEAMRRAKGEWIKIMHDDDWFTDENALGLFHEAVLAHPKTSFFFAAFRNVPDQGKPETVRCSWWDRLVLKASPLHLFRKVYIGNPSCTLVRREPLLLYDRRFKFVVDFEYYIRCIRHWDNWHYIDQILVQVGFNEGQVTHYTKYAKEVQIPENQQLLQILGPSILRNPLVYDYYWRLLRNLGIKNSAEIEILSGMPVHPILQKMLQWQQQIPASLLRIGPCSKVLMSFCWMRCLFIRA